MWVASTDQTPSCLCITPSMTRIGLRLVVRAHPGASRTSAEWDGAVLHVRVTAHAVEGAANRAVIEAVAHALGVRRSAVSLVSGHRSREKVLDVSGLRQANLDRLVEQ